MSSKPDCGALVAPRTNIANSLIARYPPGFLQALEQAVDSGDVPEEIDFDPVPRQRRRRCGWSEDRQRSFIAALQLRGSVSAAARAVGLSPRSAYRLLECEGAQSFAEAWDRAVEEGVERTRVESLDRALHGALVPVIRRGRLVRWEHRRCDRLAIALLGGRNRNVDAYHYAALNRHVHKMEIKAAREREAEEKRRLEEAERSYQAELQRMLDKAQSLRAPRVRSL